MNENCHFSEKYPHVRKTYTNNLFDSVHANELPYWKIGTGPSIGLPVATREETFSLTDLMCTRLITLRSIQLRKELPTLTDKNQMN